MSPDNLTPQLAEDKWKASKGSYLSADFVGSIVFIALAIRATDRTAPSNCYNAVIATSEKTSANSEPRTLSTPTSALLTQCQRTTSVDSVREQ
jgi:hypothetical protein